MTLMVGTAGWSIPRALSSAFEGEGTHLMRYARVLSCAEINSSFYRPHAQKTYQRWASLTPDGFRFAVKVPRSITHEQRLKQSRTLLTAFIDQASGLGDKLGPVLVQLPPSLRYEKEVTERFFSLLRELHQGSVVCEPRHASWFDSRTDQLFSDYRITRVIADPPSSGAMPYDNDRQINVNESVTAYYRLHGSPRMYWSRYSAPQLAKLHDTIAKLPHSAETWCIFDNTASGAAIENAIELKALQDAA